MNYLLNLSPPFLRFIKLKEPLIKMKEMAEHTEKLEKIRHSDWPIMNNVVTVLQVGVRHAKSKTFSTDIFLNLKK